MRLLSLSLLLPASLLIAGCGTCKAPTAAKQEPLPVVSEPAPPPPAPVMTEPAPEPEKPVMRPPRRDRN